MKILISLNVILRNGPYLYQANPCISPETPKIRRSQLNPHHIAWGKSDDCSRAAYLTGRADAKHMACSFGLFWGLLAGESRQGGELLQVGVHGGHSDVDLIPHKSQVCSKRRSLLFEHLYDLGLLLY